jgi:alpha-D-xyloside xylohydrolase
VRLIVVAALAVASCNGSDLPAEWTLTAPGVTLTVERAPYSFTVRDASGQLVLSSLAAGKHDGYGAVGWTSGSLDWGIDVSPGYFTFDTTFDPWRDAWTVVAAAQPDASSLDVVLASSAGRVRVRHALYGSAVRIEASIDGDAGAATKPRAWSAGFASAADEAFMGFGERYDRIDQRGLAIYTWAEEGGLGLNEMTPRGPANPWPNGETMTYYPVPFFLSSKGYGFWLDTTWRSEFDLASDRADAWRAWHVGPQLAYEIYLPTPGDARPWPYQIIDSFTARTGRPMVPPAWSYGPRRRMNSFAMQQGMLEMDAMRALGLTITAMDDNTHFLPAADDQAPGKTAQLSAGVIAGKQRGYRMNAYYNPYVAQSTMLPSAPDLAYGLSHNYFLRDGSGAPSVVWLISGTPLNVLTVDFTSPDATAWFQSLLGRARDIGYDGWMYDFGEYVQPDVVAANGMTGEELHNLFPRLYDQAAHDWLEAHYPGDWFFYARSGTTGSQQFVPIVWGGDPDASFDDANGLPAMMRGGLNLGISGVAHWGSDIGGFKCNGEGHAGANGELVARWIEFGSVSPEMHDEDACSDAMDSGSKASIWTSPDAMNAWRTYAKLHARLQPYLIALSQNAHATGAPLMRALFLEHPDARFTQVGDAYYLGDALLVAPVVARGATTKSIVLPDGFFLDWQDQTLYTGGQTVTVPAPLAKLPLLLRDGRLLPLLDPRIETLADWPHAPFIGPSDVRDVLDVVGLISTTTGHATFSGFEGATFDAAWTGKFAPPSLPQAQSDDGLATCAGCWSQSQLAANLQRVRVSMPAGHVTAGGLTLDAKTARRVRWDLYLVE